MPACGPLRGRAARRDGGASSAEILIADAIGDTLPEGQVGFLRFRGKSSVASSPPLVPQITQGQNVLKLSLSVMSQVVGVTSKGLLTIQVSARPAMR